MADSLLGIVMILVGRLCFCLVEPECSPYLYPKYMPLYAYSGERELQVLL